MRYSFSYEGLTSVQGFQDRQQKIHQALAINYHDKPNVAIHLRDIVVTMMVSYFLEQYSILAFLRKRWLSDNPGYLQNDLSVGRAVIMTMITT